MAKKQVKPTISFWLALDPFGEEFDGTFEYNSAPVIDDVEVKTFDTSEDLEAYFKSVL